MFWVYAHWGGRLVKRSKKHLYQFSGLFFPPQHIWLFLNPEMKVAAFTADINNEHGSCCNNARNAFFLSGAIERKVRIWYINLLYCVLQVFKSSLQLFWHSTASHTSAPPQKLHGTKQNTKNCILWCWLLSYMQDSALCILIGPHCSYYCAHVAPLFNAAQPLRAPLGRMG